MLQQSDLPAAAETGEKRRLRWLHMGRSCIPCTLFAFSRFHKGWSKVEHVELFDNVFKGLKDDLLSSS